MFYVYKIINLVNGKTYIGKGGKADRWKRHQIIAFGGKTKYPYHYQYLHEVINKYGVHNFSYEIIEECETEELAFEREIYYIAMYKTNINRYGKEFGYNLTDGGEGSSGRPQSEKTRGKISKAHKGKFDAENNPFFGKSHTEETKAKIGASSKGRCAGEKNFWFGKQLPEAIRKKISESKKGILVGKDNPFYGRTHTEETKKKISKAKRRFTDQDIRDMRKMLVDGKSNREVARAYDLDPSEVSRIKTGKKYSDVK